MRERSVDLWSDPVLTVSAHRHADGTVVIEGHDVAYAQMLDDPDVTEYEYGLTVAPAALPSLLGALEAPADADVLDVLVAHAEELVRTGESRWFAQHGVPAEFWARFT